MNRSKTVVEESSSNIVIMDVFSKLVQERIIFIDGPIDEDLANEVIAQLLYLDSVDNNKEISIYINSPGGYVHQGLAIYDIAKIIKAPIKTVCIGEAASMGFILMLMGNERYATKHSQFMVHEVSGYAFGKLTDMKVSVKHADHLQKCINDIILERTNITDIDYYMSKDTWLTSEECLELGVINKIL